MTSDAARSAAPRRSALAALLRDAARFDRTQADPVVSARNAAGVVAPLIIGQLAGNVAFGLAATIGALQTAFADRPGPYRLRMLRMIGCAAAATITSGLAILCSRSDAAAVSLVMVLAFLAGLMVAGGPSAAQVGVASVAAALVLGHLQQPPAAAWHIGMFVLAGGAGQTLLAIAAWPLRRHRPERLALAGLYRELAAAARRPAGTGVGPPATDTLGAVRSTLYGLGHDHGPSVEAYRVLLDEGERVRREILVIIGLAERLAARNEAGMADVTRHACAAAADVLAEVAEALSEPRPVLQGVIDHASDIVAAAIQELDSPGASSARLSRGAAAERLRTLSGQLRTIVDVVRTGASEGGLASEGGTTLPRGLRDPLAVIRANLNIGSPVAMHAARNALLVGGSDLVVRLADVNRGYWVPLTVLVVLRPDFGTTLQRAAMRVVGTLLGLLLASGLVRVLPTSGWWEIALIAVSFFAMRLAGPRNIGLSAVALSAMVVVLLEINGVPAHTTVVNRALATLIGGALAVLAVLAVPSWERQYLPARLVALLDAYRDYVLRVADLNTDRSTLQRARAACRMARTNAQASVDRARAEPVAAADTIELAEGVLAHTHRFIHAVLAIEALRPALRAGGGTPMLNRFFAAVIETLAVARTALADTKRPAPVAALGPLQHELGETLLAHPERVNGADSALTVLDATDRIANSLDTMLDQLRRTPVTGGVKADA